MKKFVCVIICVLTVLLMSSCKKEMAGQDESRKDVISTISQELLLSSQNKTEEVETESVTESKNSQASKETSKPQYGASSENKPGVESIKASSSTQASSVVQTSSAYQTSSASNQTLPTFSYTVNDAENKRGLSTEGKGFSFGVAKNGVPHSQSVINQQTFDAFQNVKALALDTKTKEKVMYLTFDNGYEYKNLTADILNTLKEKNVKAAFFVTLSYAKQNPGLVRRMIDEGHIVGNHSATHPSFPKLTRTEMAQEIAALDNYLRENFSYTSPYFRFPSGEYSECALELVTSIGFKSVFWSVAHTDWDTSAQKGADNAFSTVTSRFHPGAVILLHAVSQDNTDALGRIIDDAHSKGYKFKTLNDYPF